MIIEVLYSNVALLYGDQGNILLLRQTLPDATFVFTQFPQTPMFVNKDVDMIILGGSSESWQLKILDKLMPHKDRIATLIDMGKIFLVTSNGLDIFGQSITDEWNQTVKALGIFDFEVKVNQMKRVNDRILGTFKDMIMVGFKTQFSLAYGHNRDNHFIRVSKGFGFNQDSIYEGITVKNFYGTHCVGPLLVLNPIFTSYLLKQLTNKEVGIPFYDDLMLAYKKRIVEFNDPKKTHNT